ncbi:hypothetical protein RAS1_03510 [Phycisphaerae bacterium RAS1]|nr:hypothetical protein RAS1_03510 [Phycisphaerae bacterium RAS1]
MKTTTTALQEAIDADGRSWVAIAAASGTDKAQIGRFMRGVRSVTLDTADRICLALGLRCELVRTKSATKATTAKAAKIRKGR